MYCLTDNSPIFTEPRVAGDSKSAMLYVTPHVYSPFGWVQPYRDPSARDPSFAAVCGKSEKHMWESTAVENEVIICADWRSTPF